MDEEISASKAASALGKIRTAKKSAASQENLETARKNRWADPVTRAKHGEAVRAAWKRRKEALIDAQKKENQ